MTALPSDGPRAVPELHTQLVDVTPEKAAAWLAQHNASNRSISKHIVKQYAAEMSGGHWMLTHQGPAFDNSGRLIDGQHRLAAVVESGIAIPMYVTFGADPETFTVLDTNYKRQAAHLIPGPRSTIKAGAARWLFNLPRLQYQHRVTNREVHALVADWHTMQDGADLAQAVYRATRINSSIHAALLALALTTPAAELVPAWVDGLVNGAGLEATDSRLHLRTRWALEHQYLNSSQARMDSAHLLTRAWGAYVTGQPTSRLQLPRSDAQKAWPSPTFTVKR